MISHTNRAPKLWLAPGDKDLTEGRERIHLYLNRVDELRNLQVKAWAKIFFIIEHEGTRAKAYTEA